MGAPLTKLLLQHSCPYLQWCHKRIIWRTKQHSAPPTGKSRLCLHICERGNLHMQCKLWTTSRFYSPSTQAQPAASGCGYAMCGCLASLWCSSWVMSIQLNMFCKNLTTSLVHTLNFDEHKIRLDSLLFHLQLLQ